MTKLLDSIKINIHCILLFIVLAFNINFFYLLDNDVFHLKDLNIVIILVWVLTFLVSSRFKINKKILINFSILFGGCILLAITSSIQSYMLYSQNFILGFRAQRLWIIYPIVYFILHSLLLRKKICIQQIVKVLYLFCFIELFIGFLQFLVYEHIDFTNVMTTNRYGDYRFYFNDEILNLMLIYSFIEYIRGKSKIFNLTYIFLALLFHLFITKGRMSFITLSMTLFLILFVFSKISMNKKSKLMFFFFLIFLAICFTSMGKDIINVIFGVSENTTASIREQGRQFYIETIKKYPLLGGGYINTLWAPAFAGANMDQGIFIVDNGVFGFMFEYGLLGLFFLLLFYIFLIKKAVYVYKQTNNSFFIGYIIFSILGMYTLLKMGTTSSLETPIFMTLICYSFGKVRGKEYA